MNYLVVYDDTGTIISGPMQGDVREPQGIPFMWVEIPQGKRLVSIDTTKNPHEPIFEDLPRGEISVLSEKVDTATETIDLILTEIIPSILSSL